MKSDTVEFWNEIWSTMDHTFADYDELLVQHVTGLKPGRALDLGCGSGGNAVWLAQRGWQVTAVDFSEAGIEKARNRAADQRVHVDFVVSDVTVYWPTGPYDLIASFYIQLWPRQRAQMLSHAVAALAPGGRLLFVSHDQSAPPEGWSEEDLASLTNPQEVAAELPGLSIERAEVVEETGANSHGLAACAGHDSSELEHQSSQAPGGLGRCQGATTVVIGIKEGSFE